MLTYEYGTTIFHRLDPRSKLVAQVGFALAAVTATDPTALAVLTLAVLGTLFLAHLSPLRVLRAYWFVLVLLAVAPLFAMLEPGSPWLVPERAPPSLVAGYQVVLVLSVSAVYVRTTPVRETRAAIQRHVPGRPGQLLGVGVALVFRFVPVLARDIAQIRLAIRARGGERLPVRKRIQTFSLVGLQRALSRADTLALALQARCFAWNATMPQLRFTALDYPVLATGVLLAGAGVISL